MATRGYFTTGSLLAFMFLGIVRGTFSIVIHFAVLSYRSPSLVFLLRCPGTILLYMVFMAFLAKRRLEDKASLLHSLRNVSSLWKCAVMGLVQLAAPYLLFMYGLKILNPTAGGVFMAAAPWFTIIIERLPFIQHKSSLTTGKVLAMILGFTGIIMVSAADIMLAFRKTATCVQRTNGTAVFNNTIVNGTTNHTINPSGINPPVGLVCIPYTAGQVSAGFLALIGGSVMWAISSVFWKAKKGDVNYVVGGVLNNLFGGIYALVIFGFMSRYENLSEVNWGSRSGVGSLLFLTVVSGWLAAIIVDYMYKEVGPVSTNKVLCLVPLVTWFEDWMFVRKFKMNFPIEDILLEVIGLVLVFVGLVSSSLETEGFRSSLQAPLLDPSTESVNSSRPFNDDNITDMDDGITSEEEVENGSLTYSSMADMEDENPFPPLVEVKRSNEY